MCGRVIQSSAPIRYAIVDGMDVRDSRVHNYPPRAGTAAPSQDLLVITAQPQDGRGITRSPPLGPHSRTGARTRQAWPQADQRQMRDRRAPCRRSGRPTASGRCILPVDGFYEWKAIEGQRGQSSRYAIAMKDGSAVRHRRDVGKLARPGVQGSGFSTFAVITTDANELVAQIHDRMPAHPRT